MAGSESTWPSQEEAQGIHSRLLVDDPVAPSELADIFLGLLIRWMIQNNPRIDSHMCATAAEDAIMALIKNPKSYESSRQSLKVYLQISATGDLRNALRAENRHKQRRAEFDNVELFPVVGNLVLETADPALVHELKETLEEALSSHSIPQPVLAGLTPQETRVIELMHQGERRTEVFAQVLGVGHLTPMLQRKEVKRAKDRLKRRLERAGERDG